jgi:hypothetical protein
MAYSAKRFGLWFLTFEVPLLAALLPVSCVADPICPWINAATVGGALEGKVTVAFSPDKDGGTCDFVRTNGEFVYGVHVLVATLQSPADFAPYAARCGSRAELLKAIGNEAYICDLGFKDKQNAEQVVGRVRNQAFVIQVKTNDASMRTSLHDKAVAITEQVAGILF